MHSLALLVLRFLCKTFSKLLKFTLRNTLPRGQFLKKLFIQMENLNDYKLVRVTKLRQLKRCSK